MFGLIWNHMQWTRIYSMKYAHTDGLDVQQKCFVIQTSIRQNLELANYLVCLKLVGSINLSNAHQMWTVKSSDLHNSVITLNFIV